MQTYHPRGAGKSIFSHLLPHLPQNRRASRTFVSLLRRRKLRLLAQTGLFTPDFVQFCSYYHRRHW